MDWGSDPHHLRFRELRGWLLDTGGFYEGGLAAKEAQKQVCIFSWKYASH